MNKKNSPLQISKLESLFNQVELKSDINHNTTPKITPMETLGYSGSKFYSITQTNRKTEKTSYILKQTILSEDWLSQRVEDKMGREGKILTETDFNSLNNIFDLPYVAVTIEDGEVCLLMEDLSDFLLPDERKPISAKSESLILSQLAKMHAAFWNKRDFTNYSWMLKPKDYLYIMGPLDLEQKNEDAKSARNVDQMIFDGWNIVERLLPKDLSKKLRQSPEQLFNKWEKLPKTLLHGDTKLANFAIKPGGKLSLFDWAFVGYGPSTFDIGWYIAVNASRLSQTKEKVFQEYKAKLEDNLDSSFDDETWQNLMDAGILCGAMMLLWSKALGIENKREGAEDEWKWWLNQLNRILS